MRRAFIVFFGLSLLFAACTQRMICPAYQSAFIYDKDELRKKFSYFQDTTPKILTASSKNKYLVAEPVSYRKKIRTMQTVALKQVPVVVPDSINNPDSVSREDLDRAARSVIDSTFIVDIPRDTVEAKVEDSVYVITKDKEIRILKYDGPDSLMYDSVSQKYVTEKPQYYVTQVGYNTEQDNYMWYLRGNLVLPDVRLARYQQANGKGEGKEGKGVKKKKGLKGFFKNLFKKKKKEPIDSTTLPPPVPRDEFDFPEEGDTVASGAPDQPPVKEKKGLFGRKKSKEVVGPMEVGTADGNTNKKKKNKNKKEDPKAAEKKKEDEGDGF